MSDITYGSVGLRIEVLNNQNGGFIKKDTFFNNLYDYWTRFNDPINHIFGGIRICYGN